VNFEAIPQVRVTVERMSHTLVHHLADYEGTILAAIRERIQERLSPASVGAAIRQAVDDTLDSTLRTLAASVTRRALKESGWIERAVKAEVERSLRVQDAIAEAERPLPSQPCPVPNRNGVHEWYLRGDNAEVCASCGARRWQ